MHARFQLVLSHGTRGRAVEEQRFRVRNSESVTQAAPVAAWPEQVVLPWWGPVWDRHKTHYMSVAPHARQGEPALRRELVFCLLGGHGVTHELADSATSIVLALRPFASGWSVEALRERLEQELSRSQFEPRRADGSLRRYRFPARKALLISDAVAWVRAQGGLAAGLALQHDDAARREWLCGCPGVGLKTASWLLRNCGWARDLAILDVHLLRALTDAGIIAESRLPRDYLRIERAYLEWAEQLGACPAALDLFLWEVQRARTVIPGTR